MINTRIAYAIACAALATTALLSNTANATSIPVANSSFETLPAGGLSNAGGAGDFYSIAAIPGWTNSGFSGQLQLGTAKYFNYVPAGPTWAYSNDTNPISQTVGLTAQAGTTYTLNVDVGFRTDITDVQSISLIVGSHTVLATGITNQFSGNWYDWTAVYTAVTGDAGQPISIVLSNLGGGQGDWDNVGLTATPLPSSWTMMLLGLIGLGFVAKRRARKDAAALAVS